MQADGRPGTAYTYARERLRTMILRGDYAPGDRLFQSALAKRMGVSTTPVREALQDLAREGLVVLDPHRGALVRSLSIDEVVEIYELRIALEPRLLEKTAPQLSCEQLREASAIADQLRTDPELPIFADLNNRFHELTYASARETRLGALVKWLRDATSPYVVWALADPERRRVGNAEHEELLAALREGAIGRAKQLVVGHLQGTLDTLSANADQMSANSTQQTGDGPRPQCPGATPALPSAR